jgi:hypothetical protein
VLCLAGIPQQLAQVNLIVFDRELGLADLRKYQRSTVRRHYKAGGCCIYGARFGSQTPAEEIIQGTIPVNRILSFCSIDGQALDELGDLSPTEREPL